MDRAEQAALVLQQQFGSEPKWTQINQAIWGYFKAHPGTRLSLSEIDNMTTVSDLSIDDFLRVLGLLSGSSHSYFRQVFYRDHNSQIEDVPTSEFMAMLRAWWRKKSISDKEWHDWASQVFMGWEPVDKSK